MKILVAHTYYQQAGGEDTVFAQEVELLRQAGHEVVTYTRSNKEIEQYGLTEKLKMFPRTVWSCGSKSELGHILDREQPDLVHFHNTFVVMSPSVYAACCDRGIPIVQTLHNFRLSCPGATFFRDGAPCEKCAQSGVWHGVVHACYRNSRPATATVAAMISVHRALGTWTYMVDRFITCSEFARAKFVRDGLPADRIHVKPNFVAPDPRPRSRALQYAVFVGRLAPEKGVRTLVRAWAQLGGQFPLKIIGNGPLRSELESYCRILGVKGVQFFGCVSRAEALLHIRDAQFAVFPSECYESFPMTIVEAYANGVPVIASRIGSTLEIVQDGTTGLTYEPGNSQDLLQRVQWAISHPDALMEMGHRARTEFETKYSAERNYRLLMNVYELALRRAVPDPHLIPDAA